VQTDWARLRLLAPLTADYLEKPTAMKMAEIRQNESLPGATHTDRLMARIKVESPAEASSSESVADVTGTSDYRKRLTS
jgi:hypothetical protein